MMLKVGVIGIGAMGRQHFYRIMNRINGATVTAVSDINAEHAKEVIAPYPEVEYFADPFELIQSPTVDAVVIVSVDSTHEAYCLEAIRQKKYIFCEKPLAPSAAGARNVVDAEMEGGKRLITVGFMRRYDPGYAELKEIISSGRLGAPLVAHCAHRNADYSPVYDDVIAVTGTCIHEIDIMGWLLDDYYVKAQAVFPKKTRHAKNENLHDPQILLLTTSTGMVITCEIWTNCQFAYDIRCEVLCEDGTASLPRPARVDVCTANTHYLGMTSDGGKYFAESYNLEFQAWVDACLDDRTDVAAASAWDGYCAAVTADALLKAQKSGQIEQIPLTDRPDFYN